MSSTNGGPTQAGAEAADTPRIRIPVQADAHVSAVLVKPADAVALLVLAHGAGAGMDHPFMAGLARALADRGVATLRYQFPYMEAGRRAPDRAPKLVQTVRAAVAHAWTVADGLPIFAGGKSLGGRMTSTAAAEAPWRAEPGGAHDQDDVERAVHGIVFFGFPLHAPGQPSVERAAHLEKAKLPLLFLQGTRDGFASLDLLRPVLTWLGPRATLQVVQGADHGFGVMKRSGRTDAEVMDELADGTLAWMSQVLGTGRAPEEPEAS